MTESRNSHGLRTPANRAAIVDEVMDDMIQRFGSGTHIEDIALARKEFDDRRGRVFEDEELWEEWTRAFLEWYVVERVEPGREYPPAARALVDEEDGARAAVIRALLTSHRSLFEVRRMRVSEIELRDIINGAEFAVAEERVLHGVSPGDIAELRLIGFDESVLFGRTFCFHPSGTRVAIMTHARRILDAGGDRRDVIDYCASLRIRCERYRHVSATRVYEAATTDFPRGGHVE
jgi:hypothetical protein